MKIHINYKKLLIHFLNELIKVFISDNLMKSVILKLGEKNGIFNATLSNWIWSI